MKKIFLAAVVLIANCTNTKAQEKQRDTALSVTLGNTNIVGSRPLDKATLDEYIKLTHDLSKVLPYLNKITNMYTDAQTRFGDKGENVREKRKYMNSQETILRKEYKDKLKDLTVSQGRLLTLLISRQTGITAYQLLKEYENGFTAFKWQAFSSFFSYDLKKMYDPSENPMLEGLLNKWGYPLPSFYTQNNALKDSGL
ncbi:DUF4294 domain-containing protein [Chitinophagaceae bacterium MMS25-I14]